MNLFGKNVGKTDRNIRIVLGLLLVVAAIFGWIGAWGWLGVILLVTGLSATCPVYSLFKKNTLGK